MRKVLRLDMNSTLRMFAAFYAFVGLCVGSKAAIVNDDSLVCPFGFAYPMTQAIITVTLNLPHPATWLTMGLILITGVFYAITGLISGAAVVLVYNIVGKFWPLFSVQVEAESQPVQAETRTEATLHPDLRDCRQAFPEPDVSAEKGHRRTCDQQDGLKPERILVKAEEHNRDAHSDA
jgi:hypothetical protein